MGCNLHLWDERVGTVDVCGVGGHVCQVSRRHVVHRRVDIVSGVELHVSLEAVKEVDVVAVTPDILRVL